MSGLLACCFTGMQREATLFLHACEVRSYQTPEIQRCDFKACTHETHPRSPAFAEADLPSRQQQGPRGQVRNAKAVAPA